MNKFLSGFFAENGINFDNSSFYGEFKGYQVSGTSLSGNISVVVNVHLDENEKLQVADWLSANKRVYALNKYSVDDYGFYCDIYTFNSAKKCAAYLEDAINFISSFKQPHGCAFCGQELTEDKRLVGIGSNKMYAHEKCFDEYCDRVRNNEIQAASAPNNYLKGALGVLAGCVAGAAIWVFMYCVLGVISWIGAIVAPLLSAVLWDKLGGKNDKIKIIIIWVSTIVFITLAMFISYLIDVNIALNELDMKGENPFVWFKTLLQDDEYRTAVLIDTIVSYAFVIAGNVWTTINLVKSQKLLSNSLNKY